MTIETSGKPAWTAWLTHSALLLMVALTVARATMPELLRDPFEVRPGSQPVPRGLGPAGGVVLDLLACLPAVLILLRRAVDRRFTITFSAAHALMFALAAWIALSTFWAADRFAAAVDATHWTAAMVTLWTASQLIRSWLRVRFIGAISFGLLLVLTAHGLVYRFIDVPDQRESFLRNEAQVFKDRGWSPDSFIAQQFKRKVMSGEIIGFSGSPNTYAMMLVLAGVVTVGLIAQRVADRDEFGWPVIMLLCLGPGLLILWLTRCRAALATPVIGVGLLALTAAWNRKRSEAPPDDGAAALHRHAYWAAVALVLFGVMALVGHGLYHGSLIHDSLTFRWRYWVGAARVFIQHPLLGVGYGNFGAFYLASRMPIASEEIKDPHNFVVRIAVETGIVGATLLVAWMLRLWWELTRPVAATDAGSSISEGEEMPHAFQGTGARFTQFSRARQRPVSDLAVLGAVAGLAMFVNTLASVDLTQSGAYVLIEVLKRVLWTGLLFGGSLVGSMRSMHKHELDDRPAPWLVWGVLASLAVFLLHNTIEFGFFESGPLFAFALLAGMVLGIRGGAQERAPGWTAAGVAIGVWVAAAAVWATPLVLAEAKAQAADDAMAADHTDTAAALYAQAYNELPLSNADYAMKEGVSKIYARAPELDVMQSLNKALAADPTLIRGYLTRARFQLELPLPDAASVRADFEHAIALDPSDVYIRFEYGEALEHFGLRLAAAEQYRLALEKNDGLSPDEPKRLTAAKVAEVRARIEQLSLDQRE